MKKEFKVSSLQPFLDLNGIDKDAQVERKFYTPEIKVFEDEEKTILAVISCEEIDADGDLVYAAGCDISRYQKNPVIQFAHDYSKPPIGKATELRIADGKVTAKIKFADTAVANDMWSLVKGGFLRSHSVGFITKGECVAGTKAFEKFCTEKGIKPPKNCKRIVHSWLLLEDSLVPIPSNPEALTQAISAKSLKLDELTMKDIGMEVKEVPANPLGNTDTDNTPTVVSAPSDSCETVNLAVNDAVNLFSLNQPVQICSEGHTINFESGSEFLSMTEEFMYGDEGITSRSILANIEEGEDFGYSIVNKEIKPYANEHAFRLHDPSKYTKFRRHNDAFGSGVHAIYGITKDGKAELQALRFSADKFSMEEARAWVKRHNYHPIESSGATGGGGKMEQPVEGTDIEDPSEVAIMVQDTRATPQTTVGEGAVGNDGQSGECPKGASNVLMYQLSCLMCGKVFESHKASHRFCSKDCFHKYLKERVKRCAGKTLTNAEIEVMTEDDIEGKEIQCYDVIRPIAYELDDAIKAQLKAEAEAEARKELKMLKAGKVV